jgi:hypothetical protein
MNYFLLTKSARGAFTGIASSHETMSEAETAAATCTAPDYDIVKGLATLSGPALVALHNAIAPKAQAVERFSDKESAVRRILAAHAAPKAPKPQRTPRSSPKPRAPSTATLRLGPAAKADDKVWQAKSRRKAVLDWLVEHAPVGIEDGAARAAKALGATPGQVRGCFQKLIAVDALRVVE